jgi:hypothetical protein
MKKLDMTKDSKAEQLCTLHSVSGGISVTKHTGINQVHITSKSNFFNGYLIIKDNGDCLIFRNRYSV